MISGRGTTNRYIDAWGLIINTPHQRERGHMSKQEVVPTKEQYEAALAGIENFRRHGGAMHEFFGHLVMAAAYEDAHGIEPNTILRFFSRRL